MVKHNNNAGAGHWHDEPTQSADSVLKFPCCFPVKAMGLNADDFCAYVLDLLHEHSASIDAAALQQQYSSGGRYLSVTLQVKAQSQAQLDAIYQLLSDDARVLVAL